MEGRSEKKSSVRSQVREITDVILLIRGHKVILDSDLATL